MRGTEEMAQPCPLYPACSSLWIEQGSTKEMAHTCPLYPACSSLRRRFVCAAQVGIFDFQTLLVTLVSGLALL